MEILRKYLLLITVITGLLSSLYSQSKWDKYVTKAEGYYSKGYYDKAVKANNKFVKKVKQKLGPVNNYVAIYHLNMAKYNLANGLLGDFNTQIDNAIRISEKANLTNLRDHGIMFMDVADVQINYGNFLKALVYHNKANEVLETNNKLTDGLKAKLDLQLAKIYTGQGYYSEALEFIEQHTDYFTGRAVTKETIVDPKTGKLKTIRLSEDEINLRKSEYATLLTLKANAYRKRGDIVDSDNAFGFSDDWMKKNLGRDNIQYVNNLYLWALMLDENGTKDLPKKYYERALVSLKKDHNEAHFTALEIYESLIRSYLIDNDRARFKNLKPEYE